MGVKIITDSTSYIDVQVCRELDISVVSLSVNIAEQNFREVDITNEAFYELMDKTLKAPMTSQPSPSDFEQAMVPLLEAGHDILGINISAELSGTYSSAVMAVNSLKRKYTQAKIRLLDSRTSAMQMGFIVTAAAKLAKDGGTLEAVWHEAQRVMSKTKMFFVPKTLEYLKRSGRFSQATALLGTLLQIKPVLYVHEGKVAVFEKVRTFEKAFSRIIEEFEKDIEQGGITEAVLHHINVWEEAQKMAEYIEEKYGLHLTINPIGPVIGLHVGPGTMGLAYIRA